MYRKKIIVNKYEEKTCEILDAVVKKYDARLFSKTRVADVLQITNSGLPSNEYSYALMAHFDFVITKKDSTPEFAVEFDESHHQFNKSAINFYAIPPRMISTGIAEYNIAKKLRKCIEGNNSSISNYPAILKMRKYLVEKYDTFPYSSTSPTDLNSQEDFISLFHFYRNWMLNFDFLFYNVSSRSELAG